MSTGLERIPVNTEDDSIKGFQPRPRRNSPSGEIEIQEPEILSEDFQLRSRRKSVRDFKPRDRRKSLTGHLAKT